MDIHTYKVKLYSGLYDKYDSKLLRFMAFEFCAALFMYAVLGVLAMFYDDVAKNLHELKVIATILFVLVSCVVFFRGVVCSLSHDLKEIEDLKSLPDDK